MVNGSINVMEQAKRRLDEQKQRQAEAAQRSIDRARARAGKAPRTIGSDIVSISKPAHTQRDIDAEMEAARASFDPSKFKFNFETGQLDSITPLPARPVSKISRLEREGQISEGLMSVAPKSQLRLIENERLLRDRELAEAEATIKLAGETSRAAIVKGRTKRVVRAVKEKDFFKAIGELSVGVAQTINPRTRKEILTSIKRPDDKTSFLKNPFDLYTKQLSLTPPFTLFSLLGTKTAKRDPKRSGRVLSDVGITTALLVAPFPGAKIKAVGTIGKLLKLGLAAFPAAEATVQASILIGRRKLSDAQAKLVSAREKAFETATKRALKAEKLHIAGLFKPPKLKEGEVPPGLKQIPLSEKLLGTKKFFSPKLLVQRLPFVSLFVKDPKFFEEQFKKSLIAQGVSQKEADILATAADKERAGRVGGAGAGAVVAEIFGEVSGGGVLFGAFRLAKKVIKRKATKELVVRAAKSGIVGGTFEGALEEFSQQAALEEEFNTRNILRQAALGATIATLFNIGIAGTKIRFPVLSSGIETSGKVVDPLEAPIDLLVGKGRKLFGKTKTPAIIQTDTEAIFTLVDEPGKVKRKTNAVGVFEEESKKIHTAAKNLADTFTQTTKKPITTPSKTGTQVPSTIDELVKTSEEVPVDTHDPPPTVQDDITTAVDEATKNMQQSAKQFANVPVSFPNIVPPGPFFPPFLPAIPSGRGGGGIGGRQRVAFLNEIAIGAALFRATIGGPTILGKVKKKVKKKAQTIKIKTNGQVITVRLAEDTKMDKKKKKAPQNIQQKLAAILFSSVIGQPSKKQKKGVVPVPKSFALQTRIAKVMNGNMGRRR